MAKLNVAPLVTPGSYGLNLEADVLSDEAKRFASLTTNGVVDNSGKLSSREYFRNQTTGFSSNLLNIFVYKHSDAVETVVSCTNTNIYTGLGTLKSRATVTSNGDWQFAALSGKLYAFQAAETHLTFNGSTFAGESFTGATW